MITLLAKFLITRNPALTFKHAQRIAKVGLAVLALVALIGGFLLWDHLDDKAVRKAAQDEIAAARTEDALEGEKRANSGALARDDALDVDDAQTRNQLETIHADDPEAAAAPAGRGTRTVTDRLPNAGQ